jgi:SOS response regulatory protein OraA/RecX
MSAEKRLKQRIRRVLSQAGLDRVHAAAVMRDIESETMQLFHDYANAPESMKDEVYASYEKKILRALLGRNTFNSGSTMAV